MKVQPNLYTSQVTPSTDADDGLPVAMHDALDVMPGIAPLVANGDPGAMLAALTTQNAHDQAEVARKQREQADDAQTNAEAAEVQDLHDKASLQRTQGIVDGALQIVGGALEFGSGMEKASEVTDTGAAKASDERWETRLGAGATACKAGQSAVDGLFQGAITDKDADEKMHEASADTYKRIADDAQDDEKDAKDVMSKAIDFYKEYVEAKHQTTMAAIQRA